jgi:hypothetical protein
MVYHLRVDHQTNRDRDRGDLFDYTKEAKGSTTPRLLAPGATCRRLDTCPPFGYNRSYHCELWRDHLWQASTPASSYAWT